MFILDDLLLRSLGVSIPAFDLLYILETIGEYGRGVYIEEQLKKLRAKLKENRLFYELGEIGYKEYKKANDELNQKISDFDKAKKINLSDRINLLNT